MALLKKVTISQEDGPANGREAGGGLDFEHARKLEDVKVCNVAELGADEVSFGSRDDVIPMSLLPWLVLRKDVLAVAVAVSVTRDEAHLTPESRRVGGFLPTLAHSTSLGNLVRLYEG